MTTSANLAPRDRPISASLSALYSLPITSFFTCKSFTPKDLHAFYINYRGGGGSYPEVASQLPDPNLAGAGLRQKKRAARQGFVIDTFENRVIPSLTVFSWRDSPPSGAFVVRTASGAALANADALRLAASLDKIIAPVPDGRWVKAATAARSENL